MSTEKSVNGGADIILDIKGGWAAIYSIKQKQLAINTYTSSGSHIPWCTHLKITFQIAPMLKARSQKSKIIESGLYGFGKAPEYIDLSIHRLIKWKDLIIKKDLMTKSFGFFFKVFN